MGFRGCGVHRTQLALSLDVEHMHVKHKIDFEGLGTSRVGLQGLGFCNYV